MHKSSRKFSPIIIDQALEQANAVVKECLEILPHSEGGWSLVLKSHARSRSRRQHAQQNKIRSIHAAIMSTKSPRSSRIVFATFDALPTIQDHSAKHSRIDIVFNVYRSNSVKIEVKSNLSEDVSEMNGVKRMPKSVQLAHFFQEQ